MPSFRPLHIGTVMQSNQAISEQAWDRDTKMFSKQKGNFYRVLEKNKDPEFPKFLILPPLFFRTQMKHFSAK